MARTGPASIVEQGWPLGVWRAGATELEPEGSAYEITGLIGDDALPYRRGGSTYKSNAAFGAAGLLWLFSGELAAGLRTVFGSATSSAVLLADDATPQTITATASTGPSRAVVVGGAMFMTFGGLLGQPTAGYAGSLKTATYSTGTASVTNGSTSVTGAGTAWLANADAGMLFAGVGGRIVPVKSIGSDTSLTLAYPWPGATAAGSAYNLNVYLTTGLALGYLTVVANRLVSATPDRDIVRFSGVLDPWTYADTDYHQLSGKIISIAALRDTVLAFTSVGVYAISNLALDLTDSAGNPQQRVELVNADLIAWDHNGIAPWSGALVVPALDNVYLIDGVSAPTRIGDPILDLYLSYIRAGYKTGVAEVYNGHYLLPILNTSNAFVDCLVCRLRPPRGGQGAAWSQLAGTAAQAAAFVERPAASGAGPLLLGASRTSTSRVTNLTAFFEPAAAVKNDADGTTHTFRLTTRNIPVGEKATAVLYMRAKYSLIDAASDNPTITAEASVDGGSYTTLSVTTGTTGTTAGEQDGTQWVYWAVSLAAQNIRFRFTCSNPAASLQFKKLELFYRPRGN